MEDVEGSGRDLCFVCGALRQWVVEPFCVLKDAEGECNASRVSEFPRNVP